MATEILIRYLHFVSILVLVAAVVGQYFLIRPQMTRGEIKRLQVLDIAYALSVIVVLATGFLQWLAVGKPAEFYSENGIFHAKITLFLIVGLLSAYPSIFFAKNRRGDTNESVEVAKPIVWCIRAELVLLFLMPLLATLMARGIGLNG